MALHMAADETVSDKKVCGLVVKLFVQQGKKVLCINVFIHLSQSITYFIFQEQNKRMRWYQLFIKS